jgi:hypothetical protein
MLILRKNVLVIHLSWILRANRDWGHKIFVIWWNRHKRMNHGWHWILDPRPDDVSDEPPFGSLQFTVLEVLNALLVRNKKSVSWKPGSGKMCSLSNNNQTESWNIWAQCIILPCVNQEVQHIRKNCKNTKVVWIRESCSWSLQEVISKGLKSFYKHFCKHFNVIFF